MKEQKVKVIANDIESNGIISLEDNVICIDMGITNQVIDFRDIGVYDKKSDSTLGLVLNNNKSIDLVFKDYLLLYKIIDDYKKNNETTNNIDGVKCPECGAINKNGSAECVNCGFPLKNKKKSKKNLNKRVLVIAFAIVLIIIPLGVVLLFINNSDDESNEKNFNEPTNNRENKKNNKNSNDGLDYDDIVNNRKNADIVFSDVGDGLEDYLILGYKNNDYRCTKIGILDGECYEIKYTKNGEKSKLSYLYNSNTIEFECKESKTDLVCYRDDGVTVYADYNREK